MKYIYTLLIVLAIALYPLHTSSLINPTSFSPISQVEASKIGTRQTNATGIDLGHIADFLNNSQDVSSQVVSVMDEAYFLANCIVYYERQTDYRFSESMKSKIIDFVMVSRNQDGSFGNWKGAPGSMESTYHAIQILNSLNYTDVYSIAQYQQTIDFVQSLKTPSGSYYPLPDWDVPDMTSSYRAVYLKQQLVSEFFSLVVEDDPDLLSYVEGNYIPPFFLNGGSGYAEITGGTPELTASNYALQIHQLLNTSSSFSSQIAEFLSGLTAPTGGVAGVNGGTPRTGFSVNGLELYIALNASKYGSTIADSQLSINFVSNVINFLKANREAGSGFTSSPSDLTAELSSTYFVLRAQDLITSLNLEYSIDINNLEEFLVNGKQPYFGIGDYPGDTSELSYTTKALATGRLLGDTNWIHPGIAGFIQKSFDDNDGGFGFRPDAQTRVKYTFYGVKALRMIHSPVDHRNEIIQYILDSQNIDGGFGEQPGSTISYITHTYWAISTLQLLGVNLASTLNISKIGKFLRFYSNVDGTFSNFPGLNSSLVSTYRGLMIYNMLDIDYSKKSILNNTLLQYFKPSGGFIQRLSESIPTLEATYYGLSLTKELNSPISIELIEDFIINLQNDDGGFGVKPNFSSRVSSTFFAISALKRITMDKGVLFTEEVQDLFSPLIYPSFNPRIDTNRSFIGSFPLSASIIDPENDISHAWIEAQWIGSDRLQKYRYDGLNSQEKFDIWEFTIAGENDVGLLLFRFLANDSNNNLAMSTWYSLTTLKTGSQLQLASIFNVFELILLIPTFLLGGSTLDSFVNYQRRKRSHTGDIKMEIIDNDQDNDPIIAFNALYIFLTIFFISFLARLFLGDALLVLENSIFLFRFLLAAVFILFARYVLGLQTFGFFGTSVLALSWLQLGPIYGLMVFLNFFVLGYFVRKNLSPYHLAIGFRIAILMIFSVSLLALMEILGEVFRIDFLSSVILLPIIITPWMIDRYVNEEEENNTVDAFSRLIMTIIVIAGCYVVMVYDPLVRFIVLTPEVWVLFVGFVFYMGRSRTYSLMDLRRFNRLFDNDDKPLSLSIRNRDYISKYNAKVLFPMINKFQLKEQFDLWRVPTATIYSVVSDEQQIKELILRFKSEEIFKSGFVIKPSESFGGRGIVVVRSVTNEGYFQIGSIIYNEGAIISHIRKILDGEFLTSQTSNVNDIVIIEEKILPDDEFGSLGIGLADIRLIIFKGITVMAMARIPTKESNGLANLKQGAIGAGIRLIDGKIIHAEYKKSPLTIHPDTKKTIVDYHIPNWDKILAVGSLAQKSTGLGYAGVDLVIGENGRILVLEVNKRPGLEIQNINLAGILSRLEYIEEKKLDAGDLSPQKCAKLSKSLEKVWSEVKN